MNIRKFKENVITWENYEENVRLFRAWAENCYEWFEKNLELDIADSKLLELDAADDYEDKMKLEWEGLDLQIVINLYSKMGWKIDDSIRSKEVLVNDEKLNVYYDSRLSDAMEKLKTVDDNIEFYYGILCLIKQIDEKHAIYSHFIKKLLTGLNENELMEGLSLVGSGVKKVFVAMWFGEEMKNARAKIEKAIRDCGYEPMLIDIKEHNNQIVPEIFKEIEDSEFVIADLTGHRGGVYYEAGYAMAKEKQVILSCKENESTHFDVAQINTIYWKDEDDLYKRLVKRIKATVGENN